MRRGEEATRYSALHIDKPTTGPPFRNQPEIDCKRKLCRFEGAVLLSLPSSYHKTQTGLRSTTFYQRLPSPHNAATYLPPRTDPFGTVLPPFEMCRRLLDCWSLLPPGSLSPLLLPLCFPPSDRS